MRYIKNKVSRVFNDNLDDLLFPDAIVKYVGQTTSKIRMLSKFQRLSLKKTDRKKEKKQVAG